MELFDLVVVGAGPAGLSAALAAGRHGATVCLVEGSPEPGGQVWRKDLRSARAGVPPRLLDALAALSSVTLRNQTRVLGPAGGTALWVDSGGRSQRLGYRRLVLATGARELLLPFPGWTLPGVTGAGGLQALIKGGVPVAGQRVVVAGSGPLLWAAAASARRAGASVVALLEAAPPARLARFALGLAARPRKLAQALGLRAALALSPLYAGACLEGAGGSGRVQYVEFTRRGRRLRLDCERLACGFGLVANHELGAALGCALLPRAAGELAIAVDESQQSSIPGVYACGECAGSRGAELAAVEGTIAGLGAVGRFDPRGPQARARRRWAAFAAAVERDFRFEREPALHRARDELLCRCEDVALAAVLDCASWQQAKMLHRCGMGDCQGRVCATAARALLGWEPQAVRTPLSPVELGRFVDLA